MQLNFDELCLFQYTDKYLATCSKDGTVRLWWWGEEGHTYAKKVDCLRQSQESAAQGEEKTTTNQ